MTTTSGHIKRYFTVEGGTNDPCRLSGRAGLREFVGDRNTPEIRVRLGQTNLICPTEWQSNLRHLGCGNPHLFRDILLVCAALCYYIPPRQNVSHRLINHTPSHLFYYWKKIVNILNIYLPCTKSVVLLNTKKIVSCLFYSQKGFV